MLNKVQLIGNVGQEPEAKSVNDNRLVTFTLATTKKFKDKAGTVQTQTEWHNIVIWGKLAEIVEKYVKKGSKLYLEGEIKTESYEKDGVKKYATKIVCSDMKMLDSKPSENTAAPQQSQQAAPQQNQEEGEDLPF
jgi:single-strand DNA-binding protein